MAFDARIDPKIHQSNTRLRLARIGVRIYRKDQRLLLRATLPPKPGATRPEPHQQWIALGVYANSEGLKHAEALAKTIGGELARQVFDWTPYLKPRDFPLTQQPLAEQITQFQEHFLQQGRADSTYRSVYAPYFKQLLTQAEAHPHRELLDWMGEVLRQQPATSRGRQLAYTTFRQLLTFLELDPAALQRYRGSYTQRQVAPRELPDDLTIAQWFERIPNPHWRFVYGLLATYGLRPHECFQCTLGPEGTLHIGAATKTGARESWPFYPEWVEQFDLPEGEKPTVAPNTSNKALGSRVNLQFRRYGIPFHPYLLRHAWAVRTIHFGLDSSITAPMMGHSVEVHTSVYHQWLTRRDQQTAVQRALTQAPPAP